MAAFLPFYSVALAGAPTLQSEVRLSSGKAKLEALRSNKNVFAMASDFVIQNED